MRLRVAKKVWGVFLPAFLEHVKKQRDYRPRHRHQTLQAAAQRTLKSELRWLRRPFAASAGPASAGQS